MDLEHNFNFNDPVEVTTIFRMPEISGKPKEYSSKISFGWEDIKLVEEHAYADDWETYKGPKYWITLHHEPQGRLVLGSYMSMTEHWRHFRNRYPLFRDAPTDED